MGSDDGHKGIPSWQRPQSTPESSSIDGPTASLEDTTQDGSGRSQEVLVEQAVKFLRDDSIRDAPLEEKVSFLESKGLNKTNIDKAILLLESNSTNSSSTTQTINTPEPSLQTSPQSAPSPARDIPPIITYPEFLVHSQKPAPLVTAQRLLTVGYIAGSISAAIYGAHKFLISPMSDSLTSARHDFASHAQDHLAQLNEKLAEIVSTDPQTISKPQTQPPKLLDDNTDIDSVTSDPTELFHRDQGTQTDPSTSQAAVTTNTTTAASDTSSDDNPNRNPVEQQTDKLKEIRRLTRRMNEDIASESQTQQEISTTIKVLNEYLEKISYPSNATYGLYGGTSYTTGPGAKKEDDEMQRMKAEIRSVKGVLLSARNFPGGRRAMFPPASAAAS